MEKMPQIKGLVLARRKYQDIRFIVGGVRFFIRFIGMKGAQARLLIVAEKSEVKIELPEKDSKFL